MGRRQMNFRLSEAGHNWIKKVADSHEVHKTDVIRAALAVARRHMDEVGEALIHMKREM